MLLDKEIAKRKALDEHNHHVRVVAAVVAARRLMQRQAAAALETDGTAEWPRRAPFSQHDRKLAVRRMDKYSDKQFKARYRISRSTFDTILGRISPDLEPAERSKPGGCPNGHIPAKLKLGASLRFLAGSNHLDVADLHAMSTCVRKALFCHVAPDRYRAQRTIHAALCACKRTPRPCAGPPSTSTSTQ